MIFFFFFFFFPYPSDLESIFPTIGRASLPNKEKEGWLLSTAKKKKDFEPLYFVLSHRLLYYFREKDSPKPLGFVAHARACGAVDVGFVVASLCRRLLQRFGLLIETKRGLPDCHSFNLG